MAAAVLPPGDYSQDPCSPVLVWGTGEVLSEPQDPSDSGWWSAPFPAPVQGPHAVGTSRCRSPMSGCAPCVRLPTPPRTGWRLLLGCWPGATLSSSFLSHLCDRGRLLCWSAERKTSRSSGCNHTLASVSLPVCSCKSAGRDCWLPLEQPHAPPRAKALCTCVSLEASEPHRGPSTAATCGSSPVCAQPCCGA